MELPPSMVMVAPVMNAEAELARYNKPLPTSAGEVGRPSGIAAMVFLTWLSVRALTVLPPREALQAKLQLAIATARLRLLQQADDEAADEPDADPDPPPETSA